MSVGGEPGVTPSRKERGMRGMQEEPWWLRVSFLEMREDDEDNDDDGDEEESEEDNDNSDDDDQDSGQSNQNNDDVEGLKSALAKERKDRKRFEKELKRIQRRQEQQATEEENELEATKASLQTSTAKVERLGELLVKSAIDTAIMEAATAEKFRDVSDALDLVDRSEIDVDLDLDDDEVVFEFDKASVVSAVKKLATKKPHLILADGDEEASGSKTGSKKGKKGDQSLTEESLKKRYPVLRG